MHLIEVGHPYSDYNEDLDLYADIIDALADRESLNQLEGQDPMDPSFIAVGHLINVVNSAL